MDGARFHLAKSYLAARGRRFGTDTATGWTLAHGGLLPEEVVIPVLEWFGNEDQAYWPSVAFPDGAEFDRNGWVLPVLLSNPHARPVSSGSISVSVLGTAGHIEQVFPRLKPGTQQRLEFRLAGDNLPDGEKLCVDVTIRMRAERGSGEVTQTNQYLVDRAKRLVERTAEQDDFEGMF